MNESVFGTNTTGKKLADIWTEISVQPNSFFEVTVKTVNEKRLKDAAASIRQNAERVERVTFLCLMPENISELGAMENSIVVDSRQFDFVDIRAFVSVMMSLLSDKDLEIFRESVEGFMKDKQRAERTQKGWNEIFGK